MAKQPGKQPAANDVAPDTAPAAPEPRRSAAPGKLGGDMAVRNLKTPGYHSDGGNLWLRITASGSKSWAFIYTRLGKTREMGLGNYPTITLGSIDGDSLDTARGQARAARLLIRQGIDPIEARRAEQAERDSAQAQAQVEARDRTFEAVAKAYIRAKSPGWSNPKHIAQWSASLENYVYPVFGRVHVRDITKEHVLAALEPIWTQVPETASRVRGRIEQVLSYAMQAGKTYRPEGVNPARWKGGLDHLLAAPAKTKTVKHFAALDIDAMPAFMAELRDRDSISARALEFTVLTATRTNESIGATWEEIDLPGKTWVVPAERMKAGKEHRVPLSLRAAEILRSMEHREGYLFPGAKEGKPLSDMAMTELLRGMRPGMTVHGTARSTFRDWASERTNFPHEVCEMALAHVINNKAEAAYRRGDLMAKRTKLMDEWARFCNKEWLNQSGGTMFALVPIRQQKKTA